MLPTKLKVAGTTKKLLCKTVAVVNFDQKILTITVGKKQQIFTDKQSSYIDPHFNEISSLLASCGVNPT